MVTAAMRPATQRDSLADELLINEATINSTHTYSESANAGPEGPTD
jgi:hypothetical protein